MKCKLRYQGPKRDNTDLWQFNILPEISIFSGQGAWCITFVAWLFWRLEFWWGDIKDLV